ncbi:MAG: trypsin-like peptidase domain-containing protein [Tannerellaceae bacterium]|jgi:hypothetical protein|nr:trypsin-like peptidase domain-containing protein [Tannerellaceae bacterium]
MKYNNLIYLLATLFAVFESHAQVSHGGSPLPFIQSRSQPAGFFVEMPPFDMEEEIRTNEREESTLRGSFRFAHKFMTNYNRSNAGTLFTLPDGTRVWRMGIYSKGALSINVLFSEFELPEGAQLFLYNPEQTQILGAFTHLNNSDLGLLPVSPVQGDKLVVEYHEPAHVSFPGRLTVGEVNHGYRSLRGYEPGGDRNEFYCMPSPICFQDDPEYDEISRSVVLITIDGVRSCTGVLVNNTLNDGKPYLLTASHCLNENFSVKNPDYESVAGRIVCFFNYRSPTCETVMRGTEEMSVASAAYKAVNEKNDLALLELLEAPPVYYQPYYAGWNIDDKGGTPPYASIHHPRASVKRINLSEDKVSLKSLTIRGIDFYKNAHWNVERWSIGSTASGSSGAPLFDSNHRVIGALSGGSSSCSVPMDDFYYSLFKAWEPSKNNDEQLKHWLDPDRSNKKTLDGLDPYKTNPSYRLSNIYETKLHDSIEITGIISPATGNLFGSNSLGITEYAEEYTADAQAILHGAYLVTPAVTDAVGSLDVEVTVYAGNGKPETLLYSKPFKPMYTELSVVDSSFIETEKWLNRAQESFIRFDEPITVSGTFYIGYKIKSPAKSTFAVYNLPKGKTTRNTAWYLQESQWHKASSHPVMPFNTSLFIDPALQYTNETSTSPLPKEEYGIQVFLNKNHKSIHVLLPGQIESAHLFLYSTSGQLMTKTLLTNAHSTIPLLNMPPGVYIVNIKSNDIFYTQKILF